MIRTFGFLQRGLVGLPGCPRYNLPLPVSGQVVYSL